MEHLQRAMRRDLRLDFLEAGDEARVAYELGNDRMVRMAAVQRMGDHYSRLKPSDDDCYLRARRRSVLNSAVRKSQVLPYRNAHHRCGFRSFLRAKLRSSAARELPSGEVQDPGCSPQHLRADQRSAANQLDVVGMRGDRENVNACHWRKLRAPAKRGYVRIQSATRSAARRSDRASLLVALAVCHTPGRC